MADKFTLNFIGIGAEKSGTTWIADCLREHPEICLPKNKELFFFNEYDPHYLKVKNYRYEKLGFRWYKKQFKNCRPGSLKGEFTPTYLYCPRAARRIKKHFPQIKLIVILRNPIERSFSQYIHDRRIGLIRNITFGRVIVQYDNYIKKGLYAEHLYRYFSLFPAANILVLFYDDLKNNPAAVIRKIFRFLNLKDEYFSPAGLQKKSNPASRAKIPALNYFMIHTEYFLRRRLYAALKILDISGLRKLALFLRDFNSVSIGHYPEMKKSDRLGLQKIFKEDIKKLEKLTNQDLSAWLK